MLFAACCLLCIVCGCSLFAVVRCLVLFVVCVRLCMFAVCCLLVAVWWMLCVMSRPLVGVCPVWIVGWLVVAVR